MLLCSYFYTYLSDTNISQHTMNCTSDTTFDSISTIHSQLTKLIIAKIAGGIFLPGSFDALLARGFQDKLVLLSKIVD